MNKCKRNTLLYSNYIAINSYHLSFTKLGNCENGARCLKCIISHCTEYSQLSRELRTILSHFVIDKT